MPPKKYPSRIRGKVWIEKDKSKKLTDLPRDILKYVIIEDLTLDDILALSVISKEFRDLTQERRSKEIEKYKVDLIKVLRARIVDYYGKDYKMENFLIDYDPNILYEYQDFVKQSKTKNEKKSKVALEDKFFEYLGPNEIEYMTSYLFDELERAEASHYDSDW